MTTLGTHPFIPSASKLGAPIHCQQCPNDAAHAVHDWLSPQGPDSHRYSPEVRMRLGNTPSCGLCNRDHSEMVGCDEAFADDLSAITPEEMVQLENLPNGEPFEDIDGYCVRLNRQVRDIQQGGR